MQAEDRPDTGQTPPPPPRLYRTYLSGRGGHDGEARGVPALRSHRHEHHAHSVARRDALVRHIHARNHRAVAPAGVFFLVYVAGVQGGYSYLAAAPGCGRPSPGADDLR